MGFDFSNASGEAFGDIEDVFFKKDGKDFINTGENAHNGTKVNLADLNASIAEKASQAEKDKSPQATGTTIQISKDVLGAEEDFQINLSEQEERRMNTSSVKNKSYIDVNTGESIVIKEKTTLYNGTFLYTVTRENGDTITYPRSMFIGNKKQFVPEEFYIREAERTLEDFIDKYYNNIKGIIENSQSLTETSDGKYLELVLEEPIEVSGIIIPDNIQIPVKKIFDLNYKILMLEHIICIDNKIAGLLFDDIWF